MARFLDRFSFLHFPPLPAFVKESLKRFPIFALG
jgi:hypothetical protein